ncbi:MAG TPA: DUF2182 domain-containing protein [Kiloniellaceae bacterium]|nr:DUF2182 domain-containing protein [Kiloniellaceae bacterium]
MRVALAEAHWRGAASWLAFLFLVLAGWAALFVMSREIAAGSSASLLGPGMGLLAPWFYSSPETASAGGGGLLPTTLEQALAVICGAGPSSGEVALPSLIAMWALMALSMMAPTALPLLRAYGELMTGNPLRVPLLGFWALLAGFCLVWLGFAVLAALFQALAGSADIMTTGGLLRPGWMTAALLALAGFYQFSALKAACLSRCRSPMAFFFSHWREGTAGALRMGLLQGLACLGCCWALMALAFVGGTMNLVWMGLAMVLMATEKLSTLGKIITAPLGALLLASAAISAIWAATS